VGRSIAMRGLMSLAILAGLGLAYAETPIQLSAMAPASAAQTYPIISLDTPLARDAATFNDDKALNQTCRKEGGEADVCLCLTHVMKYELTLKEYRAAVRLYGLPKDRSAIHLTLQKEGYSKSDIGTAELMERSLITDHDFTLRCAEAKAYYKQSES